MRQLRLSGSPDTLARIAILLVITFMWVIAGAHLTRDLQFGANSIVNAGTSTMAAFSTTVLGIVAFSLRGANLRFGRSMAPIVALIAVLMPLTAWLFFAYADSSVAESAYRAVGMGRVIDGFHDLREPLQWLECDRLERSGDLPEIDECVNRYGPGWMWLSHLPLESQWWARYAFIQALLLAGSLWWLMKMSSGAGKLALLLIAFSPAWLLLMERGNTDAMVTVIVIAVLLLPWRWPTWQAWSIVAIAIFVLGLLKIYPFGFGLAIFFAVLVRHGWVVLTAWGAAVVGALLFWRDHFQEARLYQEMVASNAGPEGFGWRPVLAFVAPESVQGIWIAGLSLLAILVAVLTFIAGYRSASTVLTRTRLMRLWLATAGIGAFLGITMLSGFGWPYKLLPLILTVPWLANESDERTSLAGILMLTLMTGFVVLSIAPLTFIAGLALGFFILGTCARVLLKLAPIGRHAEA